ncbi:hypothetical protein [Acidithiobacillus thiooxidans]|jgi:hypothetical protein|uniref:hypothetical protein n=1 Tax=Acidithiobacillus thiooxidans TaxID=930 RepID=UPI001C07B9DF|nr:hypothetical protein [Acidithiobacillus thiooxidans]MBU2841857.1 hypothetical protein [Acidithiobacillus thiooxidans]
MIITAADHAEGLQNRINRIRVMVRLLTTDSAYNELGKNDLAYMPWMPLRTRWKMPVIALGCLPRW